LAKLQMNSCIPLSIIFVVAFITQVTAVILLEYLLPPPALRIQRGSHGVVATSTRDHAAFLFILAKALGRLQSSRARSLEVLRSDSGRNWWGVGALDVSGIRDPTCGAKGGVVQDIGVDVDQSLADAVFDRRKIGGAELVEDEAAVVSCGVGLGGAARLLFVLEERHGGLSRVS
jgi:hypothetical protein